MGDAGTAMKNALGRVGWAVLGRRNLVRASRFLLNYGRLDSWNVMDSNGELLVQETVVAHLPEEPSWVFDVGANLGLWTTHFVSIAERAGKGPVSVQLFEPAQATFDQLQRNLAQLADPSRLHANRLGISDEPGEASFFVLGARSGAHSLYAPRRSTNVEKETISLDTLDSFCERQGIASIQLLKTDLEGNDLKAIRGAGKLLEGKAIEVLQFEYNNRWIQSRCFLRDAFEFLLPLGYRLGKVTPRGIEFYDRWDFELETFIEGNYVACLPAWVERFPTIEWWNA